MRVLIAPDAEAAAERAAELLARALQRRSELVLALATGRTAEPVYRALAARVARGEASLSRARAFALDELAGLPPGDPRSFAAVLERQVVASSDLPVHALEHPDACAADPGAACARYEERIRAAGGLDLALLGLGRNGHLAFNEPGASLAGRAHVAALRPETRRDAWPGPGEAPACGLTLGLGSLLEARRWLLVATGSRKAEAAARALEGPVTSRVPASAVQLHPDAIVVLDEGAAAGLEDAAAWREAEQLLGAGASPGA